MKIQLLSFPGCPHVSESRQRLHRVLASLGVVGHIEEVDLTATQTPDHVRGWGSPTVLVDGEDIAERPAAAPGSCRLYTDADGKLRGSPPEELIRAAIERAARCRGREA